ncbi:hypothetical protein MT344_00485 [Clavibacter michiganensis subsp. phaseoli]|jgi:hypothetical protein|uniref:hypothetical protein n=1 Tax=Clavibacter phaseoli TaxID=1734031 RepID=UPI001FB3C31A|nr:hypothetical protein [Clavibacter phaseoli]MCJ1709655.1 hypothetical protein [Clavibacter phaseoli]
MGDGLEKAVTVVMIVCLVGMAVTSFRALNYTSRTNEPAPRSMHLLGLPFAVVGLAAAASLLLWG